MKIRTLAGKILFEIEEREAEFDAFLGTVAQSLRGCYGCAGACVDKNCGGDGNEFS